MIRRVLLAAALLAATVAVAVPAGQAQARPVCNPGNECNTFYWADLAHTQLNGVFTIFCDRSTGSGGVLVGYTTYAQGPCN